MIPPMTKCHPLGSRIPSTYSQVSPEYISTRVIQSNKVSNIIYANALNGVPR